MVGVYRQQSGPYGFPHWQIAQGSFCGMRSGQSYLHEFGHLPSTDSLQSENKNEFYNRLLYRLPLLNRKGLNWTKKASWNYVAIDDIIMARRIGFK